MNENFEKYIEGLSPELQEKARACKTKEELSAFIADNDLELPEDALELVSGGCGTSTPKKQPYCKYCGTKADEIVSVAPTPRLPGQPKIEPKPYFCWNGCHRNLDENEVIWK